MPRRKPEGMTTQVSGRLARFCNENCRAGFAADRDHGAVYPATKIIDANTGEETYLTPEAASVRFGHCVYCNADTRPVEGSNKARVKR